MAHSYIQSPPDSTGKRVHAHDFIDGNGDEIHTPVGLISDRDDPEHIAAVDNQGALFTRFSGGSPAFDPFGRTISTEPDLVNVFKFYQTDHALQFEKTIVGTADLAFDAAFGGIKASVGTANGDSIKYTSHRYHHYRPGNGMPLIFTASGGDTGKTNLVRRIGLYDDSDGVYLEFTDQVYLVVRNSLTGLEERIGQDVWNGDRLDGAGGDNNLSGASLDPTKNAIWWIDFQYLGAGAVRCGTYVDGVQFVCHTLGHYGTLDRQWAKSPSLPFRIEQFNEGITASSSEMHVFCAVIQNEGYSEVYREAYAISNDKVITDEVNFTPLLSFQPSQLNHLLVDNRARILPRLMSGISVSGSVEIKISIGDVLTGATFGEHIGNCDYDYDATAIAFDGLQLGSAFIGIGKSIEIDLANVFDINRDGIWRQADITQSLSITISARLMDAGSSRVGISANLIEIS